MSSHRTHAFSPARERPPTAPRPLAWVDGRVIPAVDATVPLLDDGFLRGDAVFDAMLVRAGRTHAREAHLDRLRRSGRAVGIRIPVLTRVIGDLLAAWGDRDGALKIVVTRGGAVRGLISAPHYPETLSLALVEAPWRTPLSGVKTLSYAVNQWALREARRNHADDALVVDDGRVLELPTGAICVVRDERITTPDPAGLPILDSVTVRALQAVTDIAPALVTVTDLLAADELFVVSATRPVLGVSAVAAGLGSDGQEVELPAPGPVTTRVQAAFGSHIDATLDPIP